MDNLEKTLLPDTEKLSDKNLEISIGNAVSGYFEFLKKLEDLYDFEKCPTEWLDKLAVMFGMKIWSIEWADEVKRSFLKKGRELNERAGTRWALSEALRIYFPGIDLIEWFGKGDTVIANGSRKADGSHFAADPGAVANGLEIADGSLRANGFMAPGTAKATIYGDINETVLKNIFSIVNAYRRVSTIVKIYVVNGRNIQRYKI